MSTRGAAASAVPSRRPTKAPVGMAAAMRANPKALARRPICQLAIPCVRAISGRSGLKPPSPNVLQKSRTESSPTRVRRKERPGPLT